MNMQHQKKNQISLKKLMNDYKIEVDDFNYDDEQQKLFDAVQKLPDPDKIILYLYAELQSYRKLAVELDVSFTTAYKAVKQIRKKILENYDN